MAAVPENKEIRKWLLQTLDKAYPYGASDELTHITLQGLGFSIPEGAMQSHLVYLEQKEYLVRQKVSDKNTGLTRKISKLTAKGKDLLEGNIDPDPGIGL